MNHLDFAYKKIIGFHPSNSNSNLTQRSSPQNHVPWWFMTCIETQRVKNSNKNKTKNLCALSMDRKLDIVINTPTVKQVRLSSARWAGNLLDELQKIINY